MLQNTARKSAKNFLYFLLSFFCSSVLGFIATPLIIKYVGETNFGIYRLILEFVGYLSLCDLGLATSSNTLLTRSLREGSDGHILGTIKALQQAYFKVYPLVLICIIVVYVLLITVSNLEGNLTNTAAFLLIALPVLYMPLFVFRDYLIADERAYIVSSSSLVQLVLISVFNISFSYFGMGIFGLGLSYFLANSLFFLCLYIFGKASTNKLNGPIEPVKLTKIWSVNKHSLIQDIFGRLSYMTDNIIVSRYFAVGQVTYFFTNQRLMTLGNTFSQNFGSSSWASLSKTYRDDGNHSDFPEVFNFFNRALVFMTAPLFFTFGLNNQSFITLWLGAEYYISDLFTWVGVTTYFALGMITFWGWILIGINQIKERTVIITVAGTINIVASVYFTNTLGVVGPILGTLISFYGFYLWAVLYVFEIKLKVKMVRFFIRLFAIFVVYFAIYKLFANELQLIISSLSLSWATLILQGACHYLLFSLVAAPLIIRPSDVTKFTHFIKKKLA